jgi:hypothetical protein
MASSPIRIPEGEGRGEYGLEWKGFKEREALQEGAGQAEENASGFGRERGDVGEEAADRWGRLAVREREKARGWAGSGCCSVLGPGCGPVGCCLLFSLFFVLFSFFLFPAISILLFEKITLL